MSILYPGKMSEEQGEVLEAQMAFWWHRQRNAQSFHRKAVYLRGACYS